MTELEAHARADQIVRHMLDDPLQLRSFVAACLLADAHIAAQDATIATLEANKIAAHEVIALLRAEVRAWRKAHPRIMDEPDHGGHGRTWCIIGPAIAAVDSAHALEEDK